MKQLFSIITCLAALVIACASCDDTKTYAEELADQKAAIQQFMADSSFTVVDTLPSVVPWPKGVYYKTETGVYVHVVDTGRCVNKNIPKNTLYTLRYVEVAMDGERGYYNIDGTGDPLEILYNNVDTDAEYGDCAAWHEGLDYVGDKGCIQMIVPASQGFSAYSNSSVLTAKYYELHYTLWK
jgi:hypothetical protein